MTSETNQKCIHAFTEDHDKCLKCGETRIGHFVGNFKDLKLSGAGRIQPDTPKMRKTTIAFDIDGTLRKNSEERHRNEVEANEDIVELLRILSKFKNVELHIWSNRGADYCREIAVQFGLDKIKAYHQKTWSGNREDGDGFIPDIAIDDQQRFDGGNLNLIVREK